MAIKLGTNSIDKFYLGSSEVDKLYVGTNEIWSKAPAATPYLTFSSNSAFTLATGNASKNWDTNGHLYYSTDAETWAEWLGTSISSGNDNKLYLRGTGNTYITGTTSNSNYSFVLSNSTSDTIACSGNIENLLDYTQVQLGNHPPMATSCFGLLFFGCEKLSSAPDLLGDSLSTNCYNAMFCGCTSLLNSAKMAAVGNAPNFCCQDMYADCTAIQSISAIYLTTFDTYPLRRMYQSCTGIYISTSSGGSYVNEFKIPYVGTGSQTAEGYSNTMFQFTSGLFTGAPALNTSYYTSNTIIE